MTNMTGNRLKWDKLLYPRRSKDEIDCFKSHRSPFSVDADRILFSEPFRRLSKKSQVHPLAGNDHLHNRLIHSLEVASAGRSLGFIVGNFLLENGELDKVSFQGENGRTVPKELFPVFISEIVYAACLAHDIGNPPFGHAGEEAIRAWFSEDNNIRYLDSLSAKQKSDFTCFDGNAQSFRIIHRLEMYYKGGNGLYLTYPTIGTMVKYPYSSYRAAAKNNNSVKYGHHDSERDIFNCVFSELGLSVSHKRHHRHPLSFLSEAADDICYSIMDLEDAFELGIMSIKDFEEIYDGVPEIKDIISNKMPSDSIKIKKIRSTVIKYFITLTAEVFIEKYEKIMQGEFNYSLIDELPKKHSQIAKAKDFARKKIFVERRKVELEIGAYNIYQTLLNTFIPACADIFNSSQVHKYKHIKAKELLERAFSVKIGQKYMSQYEAYMLAIDYVTGSTDTYATFLGNQFLGAGMGPWQA